MILNRLQNQGPPRIKNKWVVKISTSQIKSIYRFIKDWLNKRNGGGGRPPARGTGGDFVYRVQKDCWGKMEDL